MLCTGTIVIMTWQGGRRLFVIFQEFISGRLSSLMSRFLRLPYRDPSTENVS